MKHFNLKKTLLLGVFRGFNYRDYSLFGFSGNIKTEFTLPLQVEPAFQYSVTTSSFQI